MAQPLDFGQPSMLVERHLDEHLSKLEECVGANVMAFVGDLRMGSDGAIRDAIEAIDPARKRDKLAFVLETSGGYIEIVQRIVEVLRHHFRIVDFIVPDHAFSAGTVLVMSGDSIWMDYYSVLGPIDPQIERTDGSLVPALGYVKQYERLVEKSKQGALSTAEMAFLIEKFDPAALYGYEQQRELSVSLLKDWLVRYKFKDWKRTRTRGIDVTQDMKVERADKIANALSETDRWHSHGRGISRAVLVSDQVALVIDDFGADPRLNGAVRDYHKLLMDYLMVMPYDGVVHSRDRYVPFME